MTVNNDAQGHDKQDEEHPALSDQELQKINYFLEGFGLV